MSDTVAYRCSSDQSIICVDKECVILAEKNGDVLTPLTQDDIRTEQDDREGRSVPCDSCGEPLDLWTITQGIRS
jgi:hypothetical protein